jgi:hypothetical protein
MATAFAVPDVDAVFLTEAARQPHGFIAHGCAELDDAGELADREVHA